MVMFPARKMKILGEKHLRQWRPMGLILKIVSDFYHFDNVGIITGTFIVPIYCTLRIVGTAYYSRFDLWKMKLFIKHPAQQII